MKVLVKKSTGKAVAVYYKEIDCETEIPTIFSDEITMNDINKSLYDSISEEDFEFRPVELKY